MRLRSTREENDIKINAIIQRILDQKKFIQEFTTPNEQNGVNLYTLRSEKLQAYIELLNTLFVNEDIIKDYNFAIKQLFDTSKTGQITDFFSRYPNFLEFFETHFHEFEAISDDYQQYTLSIYPFRKRVQSEVISLLEFCQTKENTKSIQDIIDIINGKKIKLTEECKQLLQTPKIIYAFSSIVDMIYQDQIPIALKNEIDNVTRIRYVNMLAKVDQMYTRHIPNNLAYLKLQREIKNSLYSIKSNESFTLEDLIQIDKQFIINHLDLLPEYIQRLIRINNAATNFLEAAMLNGDCTEQQAIQLKRTWDRLQSTPNDIVQPINNLMQNNPQTLFNTPEFRMTIEFSIISDDILLTSISNPASKLAQQIALKEINRRLLENNPTVFQDALMANPDACIIVHENLSAIANRFYNETKTYYVKHQKEYLSLYNDEYLEGKAPKELNEKDKQINNKNTRILFNDNGTSISLKVFPEITVDDNGEYNKLIAKINPAARILSALDQPCHWIKDITPFQAIIELRDCLKTATSSPGIAQLNNPRNPTMDMLLVIVKEISIVIGFIVLAPLVLPVPFLIAALLAHNLFPKQPEGRKVIQSRDDAVQKLGLNKIN